MKRTMGDTIKTIVKSVFENLTSFNGVLNVHHKGELHKQNEELDGSVKRDGYTIISTTSDFNTDKANMANDYHNVKRDINKTWARREEELVY